MNYGLHPRVGFCLDGRSDSEAVSCASVDIELELGIAVLELAGWYRYCAAGFIFISRSDRGMEIGVWEG